MTSCRRKGLRHVCAIALLLVGVSRGAAFAQAAAPQADPAQPAEKTPAIELAASVAFSAPTVVIMTCCDLRTPPQYVATPEHYGIWGWAAQGRVHLGAGVAVIGGYTSNFDASEEFAYERPVAPPSTTNPSQRYVTDRTSTRESSSILVGGSVDIVRKGAARPWLGGGLSVDRMVDHYTQRSVDYFTGSNPDTSSADQTRTRISMVAGGGVRVYFGKVVFAGGELFFALRGEDGSPPLTAPLLRAAASVGVRLGER